MVYEVERFSLRAIHDEWQKFSPEAVLLLLLS